MKMYNPLSNIPGDFQGFYNIIIRGRREHMVMVSYKNIARILCQISKRLGMSCYRICCIITGIYDVTRRPIKYTI